MFQLDNIGCHCQFRRCLADKLHQIVIELVKSEMYRIKLYVVQLLCIFGCVVSVKVKDYVGRPEGRCVVGGPSVSM